MKKTLKSLKEECDSYFSSEKYDESIKLSSKIKSLYPKNYYGYMMFIKSVTHDYKIFVDQEKLKELKKDFDCLCSICKKEDKDTITKEYLEYIEDCKQVDNLEKLKKEIVGKYLLTELNKEEISIIKQNVEANIPTNSDGKRIKNIYDFIKGLFLLLCLIFNLINPNYLMIFTLPFGIYGAITIYKFIDINFIRRKYVIAKKRYAKKLNDEAAKRTEKLKKEINHYEKTIISLNEQKCDLMLRIPASFQENLKNLFDDNENDLALCIIEELKSSNIVNFSLLLNKHSNITIDDINKSVNHFKETVSKDDNTQIVVYMNKISKSNYWLMILFLLISIIFIIILINNLYEFNYVSLIIASTLGMINILIHNINSCKHNSLIDVFNDSIISTVFNASLVYDLIYTSITNELKFAYGFIEIPIVFLLMFIGPVMFVSMLKYKYLQRKTRN